MYGEMHSMGLLKHIQVLPGAPAIQPPIPAAILYHAINLSNRGGGSD